MIHAFETDLITNISTRFSFTEAQIAAIKDAIMETMQEYTVSDRQTAMVPYEGIPMAIKKFIATRTIEGLAEGTLRNYAYILKSLYEHIGADVANVDEDDLMLFLHWYKHRNPGKEISNRSLNKVLDCLRSFYGWMERRGYIEHNPAFRIKHIKTEKRHKSALSEMDIERLRRACNTLKEKALIEILYSTGCRIREIATLKLSDIDFDEQTIQVLGKGSKWRTAFLNVKSVIAMKEYLISRKDESEYAFVSDRAPHHQISVNGMEKSIRTVAERAGIDRAVTPHLFRHTCAQRLLDRGASLEVVQQILGHSKIETTLNYVKVEHSRIKAEHQKYVV